MKKFMTESGSVNTVYVNGYYFGDRLLEDVLFKCIIENDKIKVVGVHDTCKSYFEDLNTKKWLKIAQEYAEQNDIFYTENNEDAWVEE